MTDKNSIFKPLGASNHTKEDREVNDYYATDPKAVELLLELEEFHRYVWEPACGEGHISEVLKKAGYTVASTDLINRGYGKQLDFLKQDGLFLGSIITNPPYKFAKEFIEKALDLVPFNHKVAMFLKITFLEGKSRKQLFINQPPKTVYVSSSRLACAKNGDFKSVTKAVGYAWYVWQKGYKGPTEVRWFN